MIDARRHSDVLTLNNGAVPNVNGLSLAELQELVVGADYALALEEGAVVKGFILGFLAANALDGFNFKWFRSRYDDFLYIVHNPVIVPGLGVDSAVAAFGDPAQATWHPLTTLSLQLDRTLWGDGPTGVLLTNVALHALATLLLYLAMVRLTGSTARSAFVAALFGVHPLHVESVAWASERKDTLSAVFWMLTLLAYAGYAKRRSLASYALVFVSLGLGLLGIGAPERM